MKESVDYSFNWAVDRVAGLGNGGGDVGTRRYLEYPTNSIGRMYRKLRKLYHTIGARIVRVLTRVMD